MAIGTQPIRDLSFVVTVVRSLESGLSGAIASAIATRRRTPFATEFPLIVRGDCSFLEELKVQLVNGLRACLQSVEAKMPLAAPQVRGADPHRGRRCGHSGLIKSPPVRTFASKSQLSCFAPVVSSKRQGGAPLWCVVTPCALRPFTASPTADAWVSEI